MLQQSTVETSQKIRMNAHAMELDLEGDLCLVARDRDRQAFARLFSYFAPRLKAYLCKCGSDAETAEEVMQEAMVSVWRKAHLYDVRKARANTWIFTIARNLRVDRIRKDMRPTVDPNDPALVQPEPEDGETAVTRIQNRDRVRQALGSLSREQAKVIELSFFGDKSHADIADQLDLPLGTVKSRIRLALGKLKNALEDA